MSVEFKKNGSKPLCFCFYYQATYSALFIQCAANIIRIAGEERVWREWVECNGKMYEDLIKRKSLHGLEEREGAELFLKPGTSL